MPLLLSFFLILNSSFSEAAVSANETSLSQDTNYWASAFSLATMDAEASQQGGSSASSYNYLSLNKRGSPGTHWSLRIPFTYQTAGFDNFNKKENQSQQLALADLLLDYTVSNTLLWGDIEVFSRYRIELPTGKYSNAQKKIAGINFTYIASKNLNRYFELEYWPQFTWNIQTQTVYENPDFPGTLSNTKIYELKHRLSIWYQAHPQLNLGFYFGGEDNWYNSSKVNSTSRDSSGRTAEHSLKLGPSVRFVMNRNVTFLFNLQNGVPLWGFKDDVAGKTSDLGRFRPSQTQFVLLSFINF